MAQTKMHFYIFAAALLLVVGAVNGRESQKADTRKEAIDEKVESSFEQGYKQIMASNLTPECKKTAMRRLSELRAESDAMVCNNITSNIQDILQIANQAVDSFSLLIYDLNTMVNGIPLCFSGKSFWNFISIVACMGGEVKSIFSAIGDFWHYNQYYMETVDLIEDYIECLNRKKQISESVLREINDNIECH